MVQNVPGGVAGGKGMLIITDRAIVDTASYAIMFNDLLGKIEAVRGKRVIILGEYSLDYAKDIYAGLVDAAMNEDAFYRMPPIGSSGG